MWITTARSVDPSSRAQTDASCCLFHQIAAPTVSSGVSPPHGCQPRLSNLVRVFRAGIPPRGHEPVHSISQSCRGIAMNTMRVCAPPSRPITVAIYAHRRPTPVAPRPPPRLRPVQDPPRRPAPAHAAIGQPSSTPIRQPSTSPAEWRAPPTPPTPWLRAWWALTIAAAAFTGLFTPWQLAFTANPADL